MVPSVRENAEWWAKSGIMEAPSLRRAASLLSCCNLVFLAADPGIHLQQRAKDRFNAALPSWKVAVEVTGSAVDTQEREKISVGLAIHKDG